MQNSPVANHELYTVYKDGRIHSGKLDIFITFRTNSNGYVIATLDGKQLLLHRLVALHFIPNPYNYDQVNHIDGDKLNNNASNLEWCSAEQNVQHSLRTGLRKGFIHVDVKRELLDKVLQGCTVAELALHIGNHPNTLNRMLREQAYKDGKESEWEEESKRKRKATALKNLELINVRN